MRSKMKGMLLLVAFAAAPLLMNAQSKEGHGDKDRPAAERAAHRTEMMTKQLELTEEQSAKIGAINSRYMERMEMMRAQQKEENKNVMTGVKEAYDKELQSVLTPEQVEKFQAMREKKKEEHQGERKGPPKE